MRKGLLLAASVVLLVVLAGCGSNATGPSSPSAVVRAWSHALNAGDNGRAADLFAGGAEVVQGGTEIRLRGHGDAVAFNRALPCSGRIVGLVARDGLVTATFVLGDRPKSRCDGPGQHARAVFRIRRGKIVLWHQLPAPAQVPTTPVV